ncbi:formin-like protein 16 isoform X1 [Plutella xylostella]|uniref:formin-like protein 16 isoform X1 n=1 Tax=Plutella xylostella TaxID=51655 RepID=UPI0018D0A5F7|nr:formin-like protein 16 isoform X1 [Plutella xylostella]
MESAGAEGGSDRGEGARRGGAALGRPPPRPPPAMSVRVDPRDRERFSRHSSRASVELACPGGSRDHSFRSVHSARVPRTSSDDAVGARALRSASCRVAPGAPQRLRRHHSSAAECERARRSRRHTLELPARASVRSRSPEPPPPPPPEPAPLDEPKEQRRRRVVTAVAASFLALALASVLVVVVTLTHSSVLRAHNQTANSAGERAADARRTAGGNLKSHPVVGGIALTPRYSPRPRLDTARPPAAPPAPDELDDPPPHT